MVERLLNIDASYNKVEMMDTLANEVLYELEQL